MKSGTWQEIPTVCYSCNSVYVSDDGEILATVRKSNYGALWQAYIGGRACGSGEFTTQESAKSRAEKELADLGLWERS